MLSMMKFLLLFIIAGTSTAMNLPIANNDGFHITPIRNTRSSNFGSDYDYHDNHDDYENHDDDYGHNEYGGETGNHDYGHGYQNYPSAETNSHAQSNSYAGSENTFYGSSSYADAHSISESDDCDK